MEARRYDRVCTAQISETSTKKNKKKTSYRSKSTTNCLITYLQPNSTRFELIYHQYTSVFICKYQFRVLVIHTGEKPEL